MAANCSRREGLSHVARYVAEYRGGSKGKCPHPRDGVGESSQVYSSFFQNSAL